MFTRWLLLAALALTSLGLRAELIFQAAETGSAVRKYSNPSDIPNPKGGAEEVVRVMFSGDVTPADVASAKVMVGLVKSGRQKLLGNTVWLAGNGGDYEASIKLGRMLRELGAYTMVAKSDQCMSACVFAFMGGERRAVEGRLGVHRPYFPIAQDFPDRQQRFRNLQKSLRAYIEEMDFPDSLYETIMAVPPEAMHIVAPAELKRFYLVGISPSSEDLADAAGARRLGLSMHEYLQLKAKSVASGVPSSCNSALSINVVCSAALEPAR
jgi:hypothetical protein